MQISAGPKIAGVETKDIGPSPPDPYAKFNALDRNFGSSVEWKSVLNQVNKNIEPGDYSDLSVAIPLLVGVRICDGVMAIKVKDAETLRECANDIEALSRRLGVDERDLEFARTVRDMAQKGEWLDVYTNLSFLQNRVQKTMRTSSSLTSALVMTGGWMQGARYVSTAIQQLGDKPVGGPHPTYFLREPVMVDWLCDQIVLSGSKLPDRKADLQLLVNQLEEILQLVDLNIDQRKGRLTPEGFAKFIELTSAIVTKAESSKTGTTGPPAGQGR